MKWPCSGSSKSTMYASSLEWRHSWWFHSWSSVHNTHPMWADPSLCNTCLLIIIPNLFLSPNFFPGLHYDVPQTPKTNVFKTGLINSPNPAPPSTGYQSVNSSTKPESQAQSLGGSLDFYSYSFIHTASVTISQRFKFTVSSIYLHLSNPPDCV